MSTGIIITLVITLLFLLLGVFIVLGHFLSYEHEIDWELSRSTYLGLSSLVLCFLLLIGMLFGSFAAPILLGEYERFFQSEFEFQAQTPTASIEYPPSPTKAAEFELKSTKTLPVNELLTSTEQVLATPVFTPEASSTPQYLRHLILPQDTLETIAAQYNLTVNELKQLNLDANVEPLPMGSYLSIPITVTPSLDPTNE